MSACTACGARIVWAKTQNDRAIPLDAEPNDAGNVVAVGRADATTMRVRVLRKAELGQRDLLDDTVRYMPHHATCPKWGK